MAFRMHFVAAALLGAALPAAADDLTIVSKTTRDGGEPTTATRSRWPFTRTFSTAYPFSSLKKVTCSISPDKLSTAAGARVCTQERL